MRYFQTLRTKRSFRIALILIAFIGVFYQLLFSPWGNRLLTPAVEKILSSALGAPVAVHEFSLTHNRFDLRIGDPLGNTLSTQGGFSLLTLRMYAHYRAEYPNAGGINTAKTPLRAEGSLSGGIAAFDIRGNAKALGGEILYRLQLHRFNLSSVHVTFNALSYEKLLRRFEYPSDTDTALWGKIDLKGFDRRNVAGEVRLLTKTKRLVPTPIKADENKSADWRTLLADEGGRIRPFDINVTLALSMEHAGVLEQFVGVHLAGPADLNAILRGDEKRLVLEARSSVAKSDTALSVAIPDLEPQKVAFSVRHADAAQLFTLFSLPSPIAGYADAKGNLAPEGGSVQMELSRASTLPAVLKRDYGITQPPLRFDASLRADISREGVRYRGRLVSDLQRLDIEGAAPREQMLSELLKTLRTK